MAGLFLWLSPGLSPISGDSEWGHGEAEREVAPGDAETALGLPEAEQGRVGGAPVGEVGDGGGHGGSLVGDFGGLDLEFDLLGVAGIADGVDDAGDEPVGAVDLGLEAGDDGGCFGE